MGPLTLSVLLLLNGFFNDTIKIVDARLESSLNGVIVGGERVSPYSSTHSIVSLKVSSLQCERLSVSGVSV